MTPDAQSVTLTEAVLRLIHVTASPQRMGFAITMVVIMVVTAPVAGTATTTGIAVLQLPHHIIQRLQTHVTTPVPTLVMVSVTTGDQGVCSVSATVTPTAMIAPGFAPPRNSHLTTNATQSQYVYLVSSKRRHRHRQVTECAQQSLYAAVMSMRQLR